MKRLWVVCALVAASLAISPASTAGASPEVPEPVGVVRLLDCDGYPRITKPLTDMSGLRLVESQCGYKEWVLRGTTDGRATARSVLKYYTGTVRTSAYRVLDDTTCRRRGSDTVCTRSIALRPTSTCTYGDLVVRVGPVRDDGRRPATLRIWLGTGC
jgi:hypothetical protein